MKVHNLVYQNPETFREILVSKKVYEDIKKGYFPFVQVFCGIPERDFIQKLRRELTSLFPENTPMLGTTTAGEIRSMKVGKNSVVVSVALFEATKVRTKIFEKFEDTKEMDLGKDIGSQMVIKDTKGLLIFANPLNTNVHLVLKGIEGVNSSIPVFGGAAGDNEKFEETFVFNERSLSNKGVAVASFISKRLKIYTGYKLNWKPIGKVMTVTKADGQKVYEIDGLPPLEIYRTYLGEKVASLDVSVLTHAFPLLIYKDGILTARAGIALAEEGAMLFAGHVETGDRVRLSYGYIPEIIEETKSTFDEIKEHPAEAIYIYSCAARQLFLKEKIVLEVSPLRRIAPIAGFFTYGEIFHRKNHNELLNDTMTFVVMSEKENKTVNAEYISNKEEKSDSIVLLEAITHMANTVTGELKESNKSLMQVNEELRNYNEELKIVTEQLQKQKEILEQQREDLMAGLKYASYLQNAILNDTSLLDKYFEKRYFYINLPRDVVSGDFLWTRETKDSIFIGLADATGHGVPAAIVSIICNEALNTAFEKFYNPNPAQLLNETRPLIKKAFEQTTKKRKIYDGMDIAVLAIKKDFSKITFAGANVSIALYYPKRKNTIVRMKGDAMPVASYYIEDDFQNYKIDTKGLQAIYLYSDGLYSQFGGQKGRKLKIKNFLTLLEKSSVLPIKEQKNFILEFINKWSMKDEQTDDISILGIKISDS